MIERLLRWLNKSTCNFLAVETVEQELIKKGFSELNQHEVWTLKKGGKYYVKKNGSAIFSFIIGTSDSCFQEGCRIIAAHTDSPCLKIKPNPEIYGEGGVVSLNVEKYGGGILYTWFDRPLSISGRIVVKSDDTLRPRKITVDLKEPIAIIPHLAIHFNRGVNEGNHLSVQKDMKPVIGLFSEEKIKEFKRNGGLIKTIVSKSLGLHADDILGYELNLYPVVESGLCGLNKEFLVSPRIDDLSMAFAGLEAMLETCEIPTPYTRVLALFDNEETGSGTKQGAASPVLRDIFERLAAAIGSSQQDMFVGLANSFVISADDAHAWHPNYNEKYDPTNHPVIGGGPVIKINSNCKYMTDAHGEAVFKVLCKKAGVKYQMFVNHSDVAGGSTLGNILTSQMDLAGVDVGNAIWAMHSAEETAGVTDHLDMIKVFETYWSE